MLPMALPRPARARLAKIWDEFEDIRQAHDTNGAVIAQGRVAKALGVSPQYVWKLLQKGVLEGVDLGGRPMVTLKSIVIFSSRPRSKGGRPRKKLVETLT